MRLDFSSDVAEYYKETRQIALKYLGDIYAESGGDKDAFLAVFTQFDAGVRSEVLDAQLAEIADAFSRNATNEHDRTRTEDFFRVGAGLAEDEDSCVGCGFMMEAAGTPTGDFTMYCFTCHYAEMKYGAPVFKKEGNVDDNSYFG